MIVREREGFEAVELAVVEDFPPVAFGGFIAWGAGLPAPGGGGDVGGVRLLVIGPDSAGREPHEEDGDEAEAWGGGGHGKERGEAG